MVTGGAGGEKYKYPAKNLRVIAVTGTNGKTTTSWMIWKMLNESGRKCGLLTTVGWSEDGTEIHEQVEHMTTERVEVLNERMAKVRDAGAEFFGARNNITCVESVADLRSADRSGSVYEDLTKRTFRLSWDI